MSYAVKWAGRYVERKDTLPDAEKFAALVLGTVGGWTPECRELHNRIVILDEETKRVCVEHSVTDEMKRLAALGKEDRETKKTKRKTRGHA